jgi:hypothetical protein
MHGRYPHPHARFDRVHVKINLTVRLP